MKKPPMKKTLLCGLLAVVVSCSGCATPSQAYWDAKVKELCEKDGGVKVYEVVRISRKMHPDLINERGVVILRSRDNSKPTDQYYIVYKEDVVIKEDNPRVWRSEYGIFRVSDGKELGRQVMYSRRGADMSVGISHPSYFSCKKIEGFKDNLTESMFIVGE